VLVMDEPAANLDPQARKIFFELLAERAEHTTMLISSHRINEVSALVNRVVELDMGKIVLDDRVADDVSLAGLFACRISHQAQPNRPSPRRCRHGTSATLGDGLEWEGHGAGPDRLRFLGMCRATWRWSATYSLTEDRAAEEKAAGAASSPPDSPLDTRWPRRSGGLRQGRRLARRHGRDQVGPRHLRPLQHGHLRPPLCRRAARRPEEHRPSSSTTSAAPLFWLRDKSARIPVDGRAGHPLVGGRLQRQRREVHAGLTARKAHYTSGKLLADGLQPGRRRAASGRAASISEAMPRRPATWPAKGK
jgi:hypothetical protein